MPEKFSNYALYWEDIAERLIFAEMDDLAWRVPEKFYGYKKRSSINLYHRGKLSAYYSHRDSQKEAQVGYRFLSTSAGVKRIVSAKRQLAGRIDGAVARFARLKNQNLRDSFLRNVLIEYLKLFCEALGTHYLTQPQFTSYFEENQPSRRQKKLLEALARARYRYTRPAWTRAMKICRVLFRRFALEQGITPESAESMSSREIREGSFDRVSLRKRSKEFVIRSELHRIKIFDGEKAAKFRRAIEKNFKSSKVSGFCGNRGVCEGRAFVIKNEFLNLDKLPRGMRKGMILIVQNAWPEFEPYFNKAAAIVTNEGGITSHGVVVAREFGMPCVVGTRTATKIFRTGDWIRVDGYQGIVSKISPNPRKK